MYVEATEVNMSSTIIPLDVLCVCQEKKGKKSEHAKDSSIIKVRKFCKTTTTHCVYVNQPMPLYLGMPRCDFEFAMNFE